MLTFSHQFSVLSILSLCLSSIYHTHTLLHSLPCFIELSPSICMSRTLPFSVQHCRHRITVIEPKNKEKWKKKLKWKQGEILIVATMQSSADVKIKITLYFSITTAPASYTAYEWERWFSNFFFFWENLLSKYIS